jgi:hypothetical protein
MDAPADVLPISTATIFRRIWAVSYELPGTEDVALFDETSSALVLLNDVGAAVWELLDGARSVSDIVEFVLEVRGQVEERPSIERDVRAFLQEMLGRKAIARVS